MPKAYWIAMYHEVRDPAALDAYAKVSGPALQAAGGRIMVTSLNCLTLEIYYRYLPLYQMDGKKPAAKK